MQELESSYPTTQSEIHSELEEEAPISKAWKRTAGWAPQKSIIEFPAGGAVEHATNEGIVENLSLDSLVVLLSIFR